MNTNNIFNIIDNKYQQEQILISNFFYELSQTDIQEENTAHPTQEAHIYRVFRNITSNPGHLPKYPSWKTLEASKKDQLPQYIIALLHICIHIRKERDVSTLIPSPLRYADYVIQNVLIKRLLKKKPVFSHDTLAGILDILLAEVMNFFPIDLFIEKLELYFTAQPATSLLLEKLALYKEKEEVGATRKKKLEGAIHQCQSSKEAPELYFSMAASIDGTDAFSRMIDTFLQEQKNAEGRYWHNLFFAVNKVANLPSPPKPKEVMPLIEKVGVANFKIHFLHWIEAAGKLEATILKKGLVGILSSYSVQIVKGLLWMASALSDQQIAGAISTLAERCAKQITDKERSQIAQKLQLDRKEFYLFNIYGLPIDLALYCIKALKAMTSNDGIAQLVTLSYRIKNERVKSVITKIIDKEAIKKNMSKSELGDMAVPEL